MLRLGSQPTEQNHRNFTVLAPKNAVVPIKDTLWSWTPFQNAVVRLSKRWRVEMAYMGQRWKGWEVFKGAWIRTCGWWPTEYGWERQWGVRELLRASGLFVNRCRLGENLTEGGVVFWMRWRLRSSIIGLEESLKGTSIAEIGNWVSKNSQIITKYEILILIFPLTKFGKTKHTQFI